MSVEALVAWLLLGLLAALRVVPSLLVVGALLGPGLPGILMLGLAALLGGVLAGAGAFATASKVHELVALPLPVVFGQAALELALGALLGLLMLAPLLAFRLAGSLSDLASIGQSHVGEGPIARFAGLFSLALFAALGGLRVIADVFASSFVRYPVATLSGRLAGEPLLAARIFGDVLMWALLLATPLLLCALFVSLLFSLGARLMGGFEAVVAAAVPLRILAVLALLMLLLAAAAPVMRDRTELALAAVRSILLP